MSTVIVTPVDRNGVISQKSIIKKKSIWTRLWESDPLVAIRAILMLLGILNIIGWFM